MSTTAANAGLDPLVPARKPAPMRRAAPRLTPRWVIAGVLGLLLLAGLILVVASGRNPAAPEPSTLPAVGSAAPATGIATMPSSPVDGVLTMVIPRGAAADQQAGGRGYEMPSVISLEAGDTIVIRNDDDAPHMIMYTFLMPGETDERTFTEPGSEVYSAGCGLHAASFLNFTTIFVSEPGTSLPAA